MRTRVFIITKVLAITLILSALVIYYPSPSMVNAQCSTINEAEIRVNQGLVTAVDQAPFFKGTNVYCVAGSGAIIPDWSVNTYTDMKTLYYDQAIVPAANKIPLTGARTQADLDLATAGNKLYWINNNLTLAASTVSSGTTRVVFVDGNLVINGKISHTSNTAGLVFIVKGQILINKTVDQVDAFLISYGKAADGSDISPFCSASDGGTPPLCQDDSNTLNQKRLTINGSVISLNSRLAPNFVRKKSDDLTTAAEVISYQPKYLIILKDIFSRDVKNWREIQ